MKLMIASVVGIVALNSISASAQPFPASTSALVGEAYIYKTSATGGQGNVRFKISTLPPAGLYMMSFAANFKSLGTSAEPVGFSCWMQTTMKNNVGQSTMTDIGSFFAGVSAQAPVSVAKGTNLGVICSSGSTNPWKFANVPLSVTLVSLAGKKTGTISNAINGMLIVDRGVDAKNAGGSTEH
jgi:hypothetical protein